MRETITFPRPYHRPLKSILFAGFVGALLLVLVVPVRIHAGRIIQPVTIPAGTMLAVTTTSELSTRLAEGTRFETRLRSDLIVNGRIVTPAGTAVYGIITRSEGGSRARAQRLATTLNAIRWKGQLVPLMSDTAGVEVGPRGRLIGVGGGQMIGAAVAGMPGAVVGGMAAGALPRTGSRHITLPVGKELDVHLRTPVLLP